MASTETTPLAFAGLREQARVLAAREASARELVELAVSRIDRTRETLNAFRCVRAEAALAEAEDADRRLAAGERLPLLGVPVAVKDDMDLAGESTNFGCAGTFEPRAQDGEVARRLRAAGAVIVGKTTTPELGQWPITAGPAFGVTRNPWDLERTPGGSSGGSAAAVAAGLVPAAVGSDGAGSVRIPAAWTNLVGIKPQRGRVSTWPDAEAFNGLTVIGPLTRTVGDAALMLDVLAGNVAGDRHRPRPPATPFADAAARPPGRLRIGLSLRVPFSGAPARLDRRVRAQVERLAGVLEGLGHHVIPAEPLYGLVGVSFMPRSMAALRAWVRRLPDRDAIDPRTRHNAGVGRLLGGPVLAAARALEPLFRLQIGAVFRKADVLLTPTTAQPPPRADAIDGLTSWATDRTIVAACPYAWPWNVLGWPAVNVPAGLTDDGLPTGAQLLGPAESEPLLLSLAGELEEAERWQERRPPALSRPVTQGR